MRSAKSDTYAALAMHREVKIRRRLLAAGRRGLLAQRDAPSGEY